jgi:1-acyl-sn-glycerol-3-phosphate acyltransferase
MAPFVPSPAHLLYRLACQAAGLVTQWHRGLCDGLHHLPSGPALLVGNHGLYGFETPVFFYLLHRATGRVPVGLTDRLVFGRAPMRQLLAQVGGVLGTRENALELLREGHLVVCYPGGSREVFKSPARKYQLRWERAEGFARLAHEAGVPVVPFAGIGIDDSYVNFGHAPGSVRLLGRYSVPLAVGLGPLPLPVPFRFRLGPAFEPPSSVGALPAFREGVQKSVERLLAVVRQDSHAEAAS